jgi:hypothetical protein
MNFCLKKKPTSRKTASLSTSSFTESADILSAFPWGSWPRSRGSWPSAGTHWRHPAAGWQWARLASRKAPTSCRSFLGAAGQEAEVPGRLLVLIGGILPPAGSGQGWLHGKRRHPVGLSLGQLAKKPRFLAGCWYSLAASCRRLAVGKAGFTESSGLLPMPFGTDSVSFLRY